MPSRHAQLPRSPSCAHMAMLAKLTKSCAVVVWTAVAVRAAPFTKTAFLKPLVLVFPSRLLRRKAQQ